MYGIAGELIAEYAAYASPSNPQKEYGYRNGELLITAAVTAGSGGSAFTFADDPVVVGTTSVKAAHLNELRTAINQARVHAGLSAASWAEGITAGVTTIKASHVTELRTRLDEARTALGLSTGGYTDPALANGYDIRAAHISELRTKTNEALTSGGGTGNLDIRWLVTDQLGTPRMVFDQTGSLANISRHDYLPFGEELYAGIGGRTSGMGYTASDNVRQKFTSKERDNETGFDYFLARYYSSVQGRFTGVDSAGPDLSNPQTLNKYQYCLNNPLAKIDRNGRYEEDVHRELTQVLAYAAGFSTRDSQVIANANQHVDDDPRTEPIAGGTGHPGDFRYAMNISAIEARYNYHFTSERRRARMWANFERLSGDRDGALTSLGQFFHAQQDSFSHAGFPALTGHFEVGTSVDKTYNDVGKANTMARDTYNRLLQAGSVLGGTSAATPFAGYISNNVRQFNEARTIEQKRVFLQRIVWFVQLDRRRREQPIETRDTPIATTIALR